VASSSSRWRCRPRKSAKPGGPGETGNHEGTAKCPLQNRKEKSSRNARFRHGGLFQQATGRIAQTQ